MLLVLLQPKQSMKVYFKIKAKVSVVFIRSKILYYRNYKNVSHLLIDLTFNYWYEDSPTASLNLLYTFVHDSESNNSAVSDETMTMFLVEAMVKKIDKKTMNTTFFTGKTTLLTA